MLVAVASILQALVGRQVFADAVVIAGQSLGLATPKVAVHDAAAGLDNTGSFEVGKVDQHPRGQAVEVAGAVRLVGQHPAHTQGFHADIDAVADLQVECGQQPRFDPGFTRRRASTAGFLGVGFSGAAQFTAQRVGAVGRLDARELDTVVGRYHAGKFDHLGVL
ncbi:hypothetical protein D3C79_860260 [compost metagenome]